MKHSKLLSAAQCPAYDPRAMFEATSAKGLILIHISYNFFNTPAIYCTIIITELKCNSPCILIMHLLFNILGIFYVTFLCTVFQATEHKDTATFYICSTLVFLIPMSHHLVKVIQMKQSYVQKTKI